MTPEEQEEKLFADPRYKVVDWQYYREKNKEAREIQKTMKDVYNAQTNYDEEVKDLEGYNQCPRCYHYHSIQNNYDNLCDRCWPHLIKHYPNHWSVPYIKENIKAQRKKYGIKEEDCTNTLSSWDNIKTH